MPVSIGSLRGADEIFGPSSMSRSSPRVDVALQYLLGISFRVDNVIATALGTSLPRPIYSSYVDGRTLAYHVFDCFPDVRVYETAGTSLVVACTTVCTHARSTQCPKPYSGFIRFDGPLTLSIPHIGWMPIDMRGQLDPSMARRYTHANSKIFLYLIHHRVTKCLVVACQPLTKMMRNTM